MFVIVEAKYADAPGMISYITQIDWKMYCNISQTYFNILNEGIRKI